MAFSLACEFIMLWFEWLDWTHYSVIISDG